MKNFDISIGTDAFPSKNLEKSEKSDTFVGDKSNLSDTMPTVLLIYGIRFFFYPNDHQPVHIHVEYQGRFAKIRLLPSIELVENNGLKAQIIKKALLTVEAYRDEIIAEWIEVFGPIE